MKRQFIGPALFLFLFYFAEAAFAATPPTPVPPPSRVLTSCYMCHSTHGSDPRFGFIPRLAHQSEVYIEEQLKAFRDGSRSDPPGVMYMWPVSEALSNREIVAVARWYASQPPPPAPAGRTVECCRQRDLPPRDPETGHSSLHELPRAGCRWNRHLSASRRAKCGIPGRAAAVLQERRSS